MAGEKGFNPFRNEVQANSPEAKVKWQSLLTEFQRQAVNNIDFTNPHVPEELREAVKNSLRLVESDRLIQAVAENNHGTYSRLETPEAQFREWMRINYIYGELGDIRDEARKNPKYGDGEKLALSNLIDDLEGLLIRPPEQEG